MDPYQNAQFDHYWMRDFTAAHTILHPSGPSWLSYFFCWGSCSHLQPRRPHRYTKYIKQCSFSQKKPFGGPKIVTNILNPFPQNYHFFDLISITVIIIMWLVQWTLPFPRATSISYCLIIIINIIIITFRTNALIPHHDVSVSCTRCKQCYESTKARKNI